KVAMEFDNIENIKKAIEVGAGVALLPEPTLRREVEAGTLIALPLAGCRLVRPLGIVHRRQNKPGATALRFLNMLRSPDHHGAAKATKAPAAAGTGSTRGRTEVLQASSEEG